MSGRFAVEPYHGQFPQAHPGHAGHPAVPGLPSHQGQLLPRAYAGYPAQHVPQGYEQVSQPRPGHQFALHGAYGYPAEPGYQAYAYAPPMVAYPAPYQPPGYVYPGQPMVVPGHIPAYGQPVQHVIVLTSGQAPPVITAEPATYSDRSDAEDRTRVPEADDDRYEPAGVPEAETPDTREPSPRRPRGRLRPPWRRPPRPRTPPTTGSGLSAPRTARACSTRRSPVWPCATCRWSTPCWRRSRNWRPTPRTPTCSTSSSRSTTSPPGCDATGRTSWC
ncbi:hypothetical protein [Nocardiopsis sp. CNR-923]|uniref:hypothetical protein n=1 Tax=Nocardiopsis sp. CNR-923 TaxID=1904965 RepID=UPI0021CCE800|nr:hypothetical protein [Nocardiopsis sp. CNR-923]